MLLHELVNFYCNTFNYCAKITESDLLKCIVVKVNEIRFLFNLLLRREGSHMYKSYKHSFLWPGVI